MKRIIETEEVKTLGRPIGDIKTEKLMAYINEVEISVIKPAIGEPLFLSLQDEDIETGSPRDVLLNGGSWSGGAGACDCGEHFFAGLKSAIAYFVYAKYVMSGDIESTRYGLVIKDGQYSTPITQQQRTAAYNDAMEVANNYLRDCLVYARAQGLLKGARRGAAVAGFTIRKIG